MSEDPLALYSITSTMPSSDPSVLPSESDYEAICAAVMETLRGRWFLAEYARRNRHSDTKVVLTAIERIEAMIRGDSVATPAERFRTELADMAKAIARTKSEIAAIKPEAEHPGKILEASEELDSIVHTTEKATSSILAAAEQIQEIAWTVREQDLAAPICDQLDGLATDIYTACSFQDLTGQRIQKVVHVMRYLEERIDSMIDIWDDGVSAYNASAAKTETPSAKATVHHDVAQDDLDQTDVDMVMDPAQQEAAIKAETVAGQVTIDHEPLKAAEPLTTETLLTAAELLEPAALDTIPEIFPEPATFTEPEAVVEPEGVPETEDVAEPATALDGLATELPTAATPVTETPVPEMPALASVSDEKIPADTLSVEPARAEGISSASFSVEQAAEEPDEIPVFFRAMAPSGPIVEAEPTASELAQHHPTPVAESAPAVPAAVAAPQDTNEPETAAEPATDLAPTIAAVRVALFGAFPGLAVRKAGDIEEMAHEASIGADEPAAELYEPAPAIAEPAIVDQAVAAEPEPAMAQAASPVAEERAAPTLVGPADFLLEPLPLPALRALEAVSPFLDPAPDTADTEKALEPDLAPRSIAEQIAEENEIEAVDIETVDIDVATIGVAPIQPAAGLPEIEAEREAAVIEAVSPEPAPATYAAEAAIDADEVARAEIETAEPEAVEAAQSESETAYIAEIKIVEIEIAASEIIVVDAVETAIDIDAAGSETAEAEALVPLVTEPASLAPEAAESDTASPELADVEVASQAAELEIIDMAEIEAVATAPVAPEPVAEAVEAQPATEEQATAEEPASVKTDTEIKERAQEEAKDEERPAAHTMMPEVTFASMAPNLMPMETTRAEPASERFAAAATATPTQDDFIPFGHTAAEPAVSPRPVLVAAPSIYSTSPYLESPQTSVAHLGAAHVTQAHVTQAHVTQADPLAAITALTDDEKVALFS